MYKEYPYALYRAQHHRYEDGRMGSRVNHVDDDEKEGKLSSMGRKEGAHFFPLSLPSFNRQGALIFLDFYPTKRRRSGKVSDEAAERGENE